ncbi:cytochrome P450 [Nocardia sp. R6R-6]|uniref:cytochrome P450 n=1 Tax=Nocardia sp. R6R-6 TaxID=3459303 RepID=UPI00403DB55E
MESSVEAGRCPVEHNFDPISPGYVEDPYQYVAQFRDRNDVFFAPQIGFYVVTRYEDVESVFLDPETFSAKNVQDPLSPVAPRAAEIMKRRFGLQPATSNCDPPRHTYIRKHLTRAFSPRRTRELVPRIHEVATQLIDTFAADGQADLVGQYAFPLPAYTIFTMLGFPNSDAEMLKSWCGDKLEFVHGRASEEHQVAAAEAMCLFWEYCVDFVAHRKQHPADDFTSDLIAQQTGEPDQLTDGEIATLLFQLAFAGHETSTNLTVNLLRRALEDGDAWRRLVADHAMIPAAIEEALRFDSSVIAWRRTATRDVELGGVTVPAGSRLLLSLASANHDPRRFPDPERFDITREDAHRHLSMGRGIHYCVGATLGKLETAIMAEHLAERLPGLRLRTHEPLRFPTNASFRGPRALPVEWDR